MKLTPKQQECLKRMPKLYQGIYRRALAGKSPTTAIRAMCLDCMNWQREEARQCLTTQCPLYRYNPYRRMPKNLPGGQPLASGAKNSPDPTQRATPNKKGGK